MFEFQQNWMTKINFYICLYCDTILYYDRVPRVSYILSPSRRSENEKMPHTDSTSSSPSTFCSSEQLQSPILHIILRSAYAFTIPADLMTGYSVVDALSYHSNRLSSAAVINQDLQPTAYQIYRACMSSLYDL